MAALTESEKKKVITLENLQTFLEMLETGDGKFPEDFKVNLPRGLVELGEKIRAGQSVADVVRRMLTEVYEAEVTSNASLSATPVGVHTMEVGEAKTFSLKGTLTDGSYRTYEEVTNADGEKEYQAQTRQAGLQPLSGTSIVFKEQIDSNAATTISNASQYSYKATAEQTMKVLASVTTAKKQVTAHNSDGVEKVLTWAENPLSVTPITCKSYYRWYVGVFDSVSAASSAFRNAGRQYAGSSTTGSYNGTGTDGSGKSYKIHSQLTTGMSYEMQANGRVLAVFVPEGYSIESAVTARAQIKAKLSMSLSEQNMSYVTADGLTTPMGKLYVYTFDRLNGLGDDSDGLVSITIKRDYFRVIG